MLRLLTKYWWLLVLRGAIAVLFGVLAFLVPDATLAALVIAFGAYALIDGTFTAAAAPSRRGRGVRVAMDDSTLVWLLGGVLLTPFWWVPALLVADLISKLRAAARPGLSR